MKTTIPDVNKNNVGESANHDSKGPNSVRCVVVGVLAVRMDGWMDVATCRNNLNPHGPQPEGVKDRQRTMGAYMENKRLRCFWRFTDLISRCVLLGRESLPEE